MRAILVLSLLAASSALAHSPLRFDAPGGGGSFNGDLNGSDITDSSDNIVTVADPAEFDGTAFFGEPITLNVNSPFYLGHSNTLHGFLSPTSANGELVLAIGTQLGRQLVITDRAGFGDGDHVTQTNPTLFIHSVTDPDVDNTQWISFTHDQTDAVIGFDTGRLRIDGGELELTNGVLAFTEATTPTAVTGQGRLYTKTDDFLYFQSGDGVEHIVTAPAFKSYSHSASALGTHWMAGFYDFEAVAASLTNGGSTINLGAAADGAVGAHVVIVAGAAGTTDAGAPTITVTGASITETGTLNLTDSEELVADITLLATDQMIESTKKWLGQVTITLGAGGGATFAVDFNYGFAKYEDAGGLPFEVSDFECVGEGGATDTGLDIELLHHNTTGWAYAATGFVPGNGVIASMLTDYTSTYAKTTSGAKIAYKRSGLGAAIGAVDEGVLIRLTTATNNSIENLDCHIGAIR